ncbi:hypothetical protein EJM73_08725 [Clostridium botulinum]|uniref:hypothetical protein n=1 Tax=Clostridium botulinum TaxID=1491 RepID=UPI00137620AA|nr:hypothetical protein [Clostridium botulinum]NCI19707.1 hypothetical protein [Clostridium botulinum]NCI35745.1 hypothetical protein [Clostridium botulinum]NCI71602.1 hypothetical protein [Clostridium botulinum]NDI38794.1 hypothetical protein [Clostridium botulinum]
MKHGDIINLLIVVTKKDAFIADYPEQVQDYLEGYYCEDNYVDNVPKEKGIYKCKVKYWFEQGYDLDGYPADGESDFGFEIINSKKIV